LVRGEASRVPRGPGTASNHAPRKVGAVSGSFDKASTSPANDNDKHAPEQPQPYLAVNFCIALAGDYPNLD
jgi:microcystin-dependent protein